jgi:hypothetical protein
LSQDATEEEPVREFDNLDRAIVSAFNVSVRGLKFARMFRADHSSCC